MQKLLFVISQFYKGGAETSLANLLNALDYKKFEVDFVILDQQFVKQATSLMPEINKQVHVCDAYKRYKKLNILGRVHAKFIYNASQKGAFYYTALDFVRGKLYDWAFFVGEWYTPAFVATQVKAKKKAAWIHNDLSAAEYFDTEQYFYFHEYFDKYIFVSKTSQEESIKKYPFLKEKAVTIYNINDYKKIRKQAEEEIDDFVIPNNKIVLLTCANLRPQKNHKRQIKVAQELKKAGIEFIWYNIGALTDTNLLKQVKNSIKQAGLEKEFLFLGPKENPYPYMKRADIITVLSDYESWSMVITEAKILEKVIVATKTSGALEQIEDRKTGILTDFSIRDITEKIIEISQKKELREEIKDNLRGSDNTKEIIESFESLLKEPDVSEEEKEKILYIIDDINYIGGAHIATQYQIQEFLKEGKDITIFSANVPNSSARKKYQGVHFITWRDFPEDVIFNRRLLDCLCDKELSRDEKRLKLEVTYDLKIKKDQKTFEKKILPKLSKVFSKYDIVCVMSEGSSFRKYVAKSKCKKKIQWIHIDYKNWIHTAEWVKEITKEDGKLYQDFDVIVLLTERIKRRFLELYPHLKDKVTVNSNIMPVASIKEKAEIEKKNEIKFVTVGRLEEQKAYIRLIQILGNIKRKGYAFQWIIIGGGYQEWEIKREIERNNLKKEVIMKGNMENPFPEVKKADLFALLSEFEGIPNTIFEALILGIPVLATDVGDVKSQIVDGVTGWIVENDEVKIENKIIEILKNPQSISKLKENIKDYEYDNKKIIEKNREIFQLK